MKKLFKPSYITLLVFLLLGIFVIFIDKGKKEKEEKVSIFAQGIKEEDITKFELNDIEKNTNIICEKSGLGIWEIVNPEKYETDKDTVNGIINNFINPAVDRKLTESSDLKNFGLDPTRNSFLTGLDNPKFKIKVTTKDNKENVLIVGNLTPTQNLYYVKDQYKDQIYTVYSYCIDGMKKDIKSLRKKEEEKKEPLRDLGPKK